MEFVPPRLERQHPMVESDPLLNLLPVFPACRHPALNANLRNAFFCIAVPKGEDAKWLTRFDAARHCLRRLSVSQGILREHDWKLEELSTCVHQCVQLLKERLQGSTLGCERCVPAL